MGCMGEMAGKGELQYYIKQDDNSEWLWDAFLNRSPGELFVKHN